MTQLFVEILVVVFLAIAMVRLPPSGAVPFRAGNALVAGVLGLGVTLAVLSVLGTDLDPYLTTYFEAESVPDGATATTSSTSSWSTSAASTPWARSR